MRGIQENETEARGDGPGQPGPLRRFRQIVFSGSPALVGLASMVIALLFQQQLFANLHNTTEAILLFVWLFSVMIWCAFGVLGHAHAVAVRLGEPLGTLLLTLAVTAIEVALLASITLHGGANPTLARDTMFATLMLVLNGMIGAALLVGGLRYRVQDYNLEGARAFLVVLAPLAVFALIMPNYAGTVPDPAVDPSKAMVFVVIAAAFYLVFLAIQTTRHKSFFDEPETEETHTLGGSHDEAGVEEHGLAHHAILMVLTLVPIVVLSESLAVVVDLGIEGAGLPTALGGIVVAVVVLSPEGLSAMTAARANHLQRSVNICLGSALATLGLTIPAVLIVAMIADKPVHLGLTPMESVLLVLTLAVSALTFGGSRTTVLQGLVHLLLLVIYLALIFSP